ncbi:MAG: hypothetical protein WCB04_05345 [Mycobacteriales bacterium]
MVRPPQLHRSLPRITLACLLAFLTLTNVAHAATIAVPSSIAADCSRDTTGELNAFIASVPDQSTIQFPQSGCYKGAATIVVKDHRNLVIDGGGSTFTITSQGNTKPVGPGGGKNGGNWMLLRGDTVTLRKMTAIGSFPLAGQTRCLGCENLPGYAEYMSNFGVYGTTHATLQDLTGRAPWGDTVTAGPDSYVDNTGVPNYVSGLHVQRVQSVSTSRDCFALTSGTDLWITDSSCKDAWYGGSDEELDSSGQPLNGVHILGNTWDGFGLFGITVPVAATNTGNIEVRNNTFLTTADNACAATVSVGGYPTNPPVFTNVTVDNNTMASKGGTLVLFDHVNTGSIQHNKIVQPNASVCGQGPNVVVPFASTTNSANVTIADNSSTAAGASTAPVPPPPPPPPPAGTAPTGLTVTGTTSSPSRPSIRLSWTPVTGATSYNAYLRASGGSFFPYVTGVTGSPWTLYDMRPGTWTVMLRAVVNGVESPDSNYVTATI